MKSLHDCARENLSVEASELLKKGIDVNFRDELGDTPLHWAISSVADGDFPNNESSIYDSLRTYGVLLAAGADVLAKNNDGWSPLAEAFRADDCLRVQLVMPMLRQDNDDYYDANVVDIAMHEAISTQSLDMVKVILSMYPAPDELTASCYRHYEGLNLLMLAARRGCKGADIVNKLLLHDGFNKPRDVNEKGPAGNTALLYATCPWDLGSRDGRFWDSAIALLARGADPRIANERGVTPLWCAVTTRFPNRYSKGRQRVASLVTSLRRAGASADTDALGVTPLGVAVDRGLGREVVQALLIPYPHSTGADVNKQSGLPYYPPPRSRDGWDGSTWNGRRVDLTSRERYKEATPDTAKFQWTVLSIALWRLQRTQTFRDERSYEDAFSVFRLLLAHGADPTKKNCDKDEMPPLVVAVKLGLPTDVLAALLEAGAGVNNTCKDGTSALQHADGDTARYLRDYWKNKREEEEVQGGTDDAAMNDT